MLGNAEVKIGLLKDNVATKKANAVAIKREKDLALLMTDTTGTNVETRAWYNEQHTHYLQAEGNGRDSNNGAHPPPAMNSTPTSSTSAAMEEAPSTAADPIHI
jgi:hypothetical protein